MSRYRALPARTPWVAESSIATWRGPGGQRLELVDVVLVELIVKELISHTDQRLLSKDAGR